MRCFQVAGLGGGAAAEELVTFRAEPPAEEAPSEEPAPSREPPESEAVSRVPSLSAPSLGRPELRMQALSPSGRLPRPCSEGPNASRDKTAEHGVFVMYHSMELLSMLKV